MIRLLYVMISALAGWLLVSPFLIGYDDLASILVAAGAALVGATLALLAAKKETPGPSRFILALGALLAVWGLVGCFLPNGAGLNELVVGLLWFGPGFIIPKIVPAGEMIAYDVYGNPMAQIQKIAFKKGNIAAKAILLGSMPSTMYMRPEEVWKVLGMVSWETIIGMPGFLITGARRANEAARTKKE
ncbi:MAG: hypothetical protein JXA42_26180 [Anaerolineales bacterium]|nr:hypothetical protein [Anaerolineales bacterium]